VLPTYPKASAAVKDFYIFKDQKPKNKPNRRCNSPYTRPKKCLDNVSHLTTREQIEIKTALEEAFSEENEEDKLGNRKLYAIPFK